MDLRQGVQSNRRCRTADYQSDQSIEKQKRIFRELVHGAKTRIASCNMSISNNFQKSTVEDQSGSCDINPLWYPISPFAIMALN